MPSVFCSRLGLILRTGRVVRIEGSRFVSSRAKPNGSRKSRLTCTGFDVRLPRPIRLFVFSCPVARSARRFSPGLRRTSMSGDSSAHCYSENEGSWKTPSGLAGVDTRVSAAGLPVVSTPRIFQPPPRPVPGGDGPPLPIPTPAVRSCSTDQAPSPALPRGECSAPGRARESSCPS